MEDDDAFISSPMGDGALDFAVGVMVVLLLLPTVIWLTVVLLRSRR
ncbi:hypothetical protein [Nonomuraea ceibae]|nr:hypothetical protein [Nonomuraea ceibae]